MSDHGPEDEFAQTPEGRLGTSDPTKPARPTPLSDSSDAEFAGLLLDLGAEQPVEPGVGLDLKDVTIAALREMLEGLRSIGEQLADSERRRMGLEAQLEVAVCATHTEHRAELEIELVQLKRSLVQARASLKKARAKTTERHRVATERWREIQKLRSERARLEHELRAKGRPKKVDTTES